MKKIFVLILILLIAAGCQTTRQEQEKENYQTTKIPTQSQKLKVKNSSIKISWAVTTEEKSKGLSGKNSLPADEGLMFDFTNSTQKQPGFWMKDMNFDIDIMWIYKNKIIGIEHSVAKQANNQNLPIYYPPSNIDYVLEVNSGFSKKNNINVGDEIIFE